MRALFVFYLAALLQAVAATGVIPEVGLRVPMRDGVRLATDVYRPDVARRVPAILVRTPYGKPRQLIPYYRAFVDRGYAVVIQDVRGRYGSEGVFDPPRQEVADGGDTLDWIARQPWSNQRVGMLGGSYLGIAQWKAALSGNSHLKAIFPVVAGCDEYRDRFYSRGGAFKLGQRLVWMSENVRAREFRRPEMAKFIWHLPLRSSDRTATGRTVGFFQSAINHPAYDAYWRGLSTAEQIERVRVPVFIAGGWFDNFVESDLEAFQALRALGRPVRAMIGPWAHSMAYEFPGVGLGAGAKVPLRRWQLEWFDRYVRDGAPPNAVPPGAPLRIFVMGINQWRDEQEWPLARARVTHFYLASNGRANSAAGDGVLRLTPSASFGAPDSFIYDPRSPVPTTGGAICCNHEILPPGPLDQRAVERRSDVLVYSTSPLHDDVEVTGPVRAVLWVSTTAPDTDFTVKLVDVYPDGTARILTDGIQRLRYRESLAASSPVEPGKVYRITVEAGVTSNVFLKGHRIRVEIASSNFPRFDRNPNTGAFVADEKQTRKAAQTVFHDHARPSHVLLQLVTSTELEGGRPERYN